MNCPNCNKPLTLDVDWQYTDEIEPDKLQPDVFDLTASMKTVEQYIHFEHIVGYHMFCNDPACTVGYFKVTNFEEITDEQTGEMSVLIKEIQSQE